MTDTPTDLLRLNSIQAHVHEVFYRMEHLELDALFVRAGSEKNIPQIRIDRALRSDAEWLTTLLGIPEQADAVIKNYNQRMIERK